MTSLRRLVRVVMAHLREDPALAWLVGIVALIAVPKIGLSVMAVDFGVDGGLYTDIATHVRDGDGFKTDVSLFHHGFRTFPHPSSVYPVWPWVLGMVSKVVPLTIAAVWLPTALFFGVLALAWRWGKRMAPGALLPRYAPGLHGGHVAILALGLNSELLLATSKPFTEGIALLALFGVLLRTPALLKRLSVLDGFELGAWLTLLFFIRSQMIVVAIAFAVVVMASALARPVRALVFGAAALAVGLTLWLPWEGWLATFLEEPGFRAYLRFDDARTPSRLSELKILEGDQGGLSATVILEGLRKAFAWDDDKTSYYAIHGPLMHAMPFAAAACLLAFFRRGRDGRRRVVARVSRCLRGGFRLVRAKPWSILPLVLALGFVASLHLVHKTYGLRWLFGGRQSIPTVLFVILCTLALLRRAGWWKRIGGILLACALYVNLQSGVTELGRAFNEISRGVRLSQYRPQLEAFLKDEKARLGTLVVAAVRPEPQMLAWRTPGVGYHWLTEGTTFDDLEVLITDFGVRYVIVFTDRDIGAFRKDERLDEMFRQVRAYRTRGHGAAVVLEPACEMWGEEAARIAACRDSGPPPVEVETRGEGQGKEPLKSDDTLGEGAKLDDDVGGPAAAPEQQ